LNTEPDEYLVEASRSGDRHAAAALAHRHLRRIFATCLAMLGNRADAEDATQETFVKGFASLRTLQDRRQFGAWLSQIARNHCRDLLRRRVRDRSVPLDGVVRAERLVDDEGAGSPRGGSTLAALQTVEADD
jgi:RNA polymerase sigma-70 factor (ECF subfamily)